LFEVKAREKRDSLIDVLVVVVGTVAGLWEARTADGSRGGWIGGCGRRGRSRVSVDEAAALAIRARSSYPEGSTDLRLVL